MKKPLMLLLIFSMLLLVSARHTYAIALFEDDFEDMNYDGWEIHSGTWLIKEIEGSYRFGAEIYPTFREFISTAGKNSWGNYIYEADMLSLQGTDKNLIFRVKDVNNKYGVHMDSKYNILCMEKWNNGNFRDSCKSWPFSNNIIYHLKAILSGTKIQFYVNDQLAIDFNDTGILNGPPITYGKIGLRITTGADAPTKVWFDNIKVTTIEPTPTPAPLQPLILLPGLGASWNHRAIFLDEPTTPEEWKMTPGVKNYDGLIQTFINSGYTQNFNFFVFNYDWRKPIEEIADDLKNFIQNTVHPPPGTEIDLVGHSLGGMVARTYHQNNPAGHQVNQVITLGSPHRGAPQVYYLWEGVDFNKTLAFAWQRIGAGILLQLKKRDFENNVSAIHHAVPGLKDLLPTFPYLRQNGTPKPLEDMNQRNYWLEVLNILPFPPHFPSRLTSVAGINLDTLRWLNIQKRTKLDQLLGKWGDGRPVSEKFDSGDSTVLEMSADLLGGVVVSRLLGLNHSDLVESLGGQQEVVSLLGLSPTEIVPASGLLPEQLLVFQLASTANITVFLRTSGWQIGEGVENSIPGGIYSPDDDLIIIPNPHEGSYTINVMGEGEGGDYRLLIGYINDQKDIWREESGYVEEGEIKIHSIGFKLSLKNNRLILVNLALKKIEQAENRLNLCPNPPRNSFQAAAQNSIKGVNKIFPLYRANKERKVQQELEKTIKDLLSLERKITARKQSCGKETNTQILFLLREGRDYLLQALEF